MIYETILIKQIKYGDKHPNTKRGERESESEREREREIDIRYFYGILL